MDRPVLIDSNVYIKLLRERRDPVRELTRRYNSIDLATCGMVRLEVFRGIRDRKSFDHLAQMFDVMLNVPSDNKLWEEATDLAWRMDREGNVIPATDILIAASALRLGAIVFTYDRHFDVVPGLETIQDII